MKEKNSSATHREQELVKRGEREKKRKSLVEKKWLSFQEFQTRDEK